MHDVDALASPQDRRLRRAEEWSDSFQRAHDRRVTGCAHGAPKPVQHGALGLVVDGLGHVFVARRGNEPRNGSRYLLRHRSPPSAVRAPRQRALLS